MIKQTIVAGEYKSPILQKLSEMDYFYIDKRDVFLTKIKNPILNDDVQIKLGSLK